MFLHFERVYNSIPFILSGIPVTLLYSGLSFCFGLILGIFLCFIRLFDIAFLNKIVSFYVSIFRGTPLVLQLGIIFFGIRPVLPFEMSIFQSGILCFSLNSSAYISEILHGGFLSIPLSQFEACKALNIGKFLMFRDILLPQALKICILSLMNEVVDLVKESAIISTISEMDVMKRAYIVASENYLYFEPLIIAGCIYYCLVISLSNIIKRVVKCYA
ncbi:amino acid ABC transporter permease [Candidatus Gromoviella agglomerans]|uniref:amino acid ABC transporter permease n=1 Tax=Candidatus Gromoviella agglomerans TaxID=2806609 RepID=UPI001E30C7DF|nr:amino acid ABC transporter permease [Candidatus Gromoviella agglomerans]UFX98193.1 Amino acid ABC transporter permease [Candidatus Gromoviella agglomerans]